MYFTEEPEHIRLLRDSMKRFVERELPRDRIRAWDRAGEAPLEVFWKLSETGVCGLTIDEEYGGAGRDLVAAIAVIEELSRRGGAAAGPFIHCAFYGGINISENGSDAQKAALLPKLAKGEILMAYGLSEPDVGGDLASVATQARLSEDGSKVILNGTKRWCTGARFADYIICLVNSDPDAPKYQNLSFVLVRLRRQVSRLQTLSIPAYVMPVQQMCSLMMSRFPQIRYLAGQRAGTRVGLCLPRKRWMSRSWRLQRLLSATLLRRLRMPGAMHRNANSSASQSAPIKRSGTRYRRYRQHFRPVATCFITLRGWQMKESPVVLKPRWQSSL